MMVKKDTSRRWELYRSNVRKRLGMSKHWRFRRQAPNGRVLCDGGESYHNWQDAYAAILEIEKGGAAIGTIADDGSFLEIPFQSRKAAYPQAGPPKKPKT
jgi:uncharacterized protein YegP (UPF0339 family)